MAFIPYNPQENTGGFLFGQPSQPTFEVEDYERNFMERLLAPLEAPQQFLFSATKSIAKDGFQLNDLTKAFQHSTRYANPWSNQEAIQASDIRNIFFGKESEQWGKFAKGSTSLAISLLYDPLLVLPIGKMAQGIGELTGVNKIVGAAKSQATRALTAIGDTKWGTNVIQGLFNKNYGLPASFLDEVDSFTQSVNKWRFEANAIFKRAKTLGKDDKIMNLMTEALEDEAVFLSRSAARQGGSSISKSYENVQKSLASMGVSENLFWDVFDRARALDDTIGEGLVKTKLISNDAFSAMRGKHLRRMYQAFDNPNAYLKRLEDLSANGQVHFSKNTLKGKLDKALKGLDRDLIPSGTNMAQTLGGLNDVITADTIRMERYFTRNGARGFNVDNFVDDVDVWLRQNPDTTIDGALDFVQNEMLKDVKLPGNMMANIANYVTGSIDDTKAIAQGFVDVIQKRAYDPGFNWRAFKEKYELVKNRADLPPVIREALGEITEFGPRLSEEAAGVGKLLETRRFFDRLAGVTRDAEGNVIEKVGKLIDPNDPSLGHLVSLERTTKNSARLSGSSLGELDGMWTTPAMANYLYRMEGMGQLSANPTQRIAATVTQGIQNANQLFKRNKIVVDPTAQVRNMFSDLVMMDITGVNTLDMGGWTRSMSELNHFGKTGELGTRLQLAEDAGLNLFQSTLSASELRKAAQSTVKNADEGLNFIQRLFKAIGDADTKIAAPGEAFMETREQLFKLYAFNQHYDKLVSGMARSGTLTPDDSLRLAKQAKELTEKAMFNYNEIPYYFDFARRYGIIPFVSFPLKAVPSVLEAAVRNPASVLKYSRFAENINEQMFATSEQAAAEIQGLPEYAREKMVIRLPFTDDNDRPLYMDISYLLPWYVLKDLKEAAGPGDQGGIVNRSGMVVPPMLNEIISLVSNKDTFGREIFTEGMTSADKMGVFVKTLNQFFAPSLAPGGSKAESIGKTLINHAKNQPEITDWQQVLTSAVGVYGGASFGKFSTSRPPGSVPQSNAQAAIDIGDRPLAALFGAGLSTATNVIASDQAQQNRQRAGAQIANRRELAAEISAIKRNTMMSLEEKQRRIQILMEKMRNP